MSEYVIQVDTIHANVGKLPGNLIAVMGYDTGTPDIAWTAEDWARFPLAGKVIVDQSPDLAQFAAGKANVADVERGAATVESFIAAARQREAMKLDSTIYISLDPLRDAIGQMIRAGLNTHVRYFVADYGFSMNEAIDYLHTHPVAVGVQFASPGSNPHTILPGSTLTLAQAGADLSVKRASWFPAPGLAATGWTE